MKITREIELSEYRCDRCGKFYAVEKFSYYGDMCPRCLSGDVKALRKKIDGYKGAFKAMRTGRERR